MHDKAMENHQAATNAQFQQSKSISQKINQELNSAAESMAALSLKDENTLNKESKSIKGIELFYLSTSCS
jgi:hypothetical protein